METYKVGDKCRYKGPDVKDSHGDVYLSKGTILVIRLIVPVHDSISIGRGFCYEVSLEWSRTVLGTTVWHTELEPIGGAARPGESVPVACRIKPAGGTPAEPVPVDPPAHDPVNRPPHYTMGGIEVIDAAEAWGLDKDAYLFNALKYIARAGKKDPAKTLEDLKKAAWYLARRVESMEKEQGDRP